MDLLIHIRGEVGDQEMLTFAGSRRQLAEDDNAFALHLASRANARPRIGARGNPGRCAGFTAASRRR
jgi:hypothetical protein